LKEAIECENARRVEVLNRGRDCELIGQARADDGDLPQSSFITSFGGGAKEFKGIAPVLRTANAESRQHRGELERIGVSEFSRGLDPLDSIVRREWRVATDKQSGAQLILRARVTCARTFMQ
jgi:hypothetical protein